MAINIGDKVRLKDLTANELWSMNLLLGTWNDYKNETFTVVERPGYKSPPQASQYERGKIIYIETQRECKDRPLCWWVYEKFVTPVQKQLTFVFTE